MSQEKIDKLSEAILGTFKSEFTPLYEGAGKRFEDDAAYYEERAVHIAKLTVGHALEIDDERKKQYQSALASEAVAAKTVASTARLQLEQDAQETVFKIIGVVAKLLVEVTIGALIPG